MRANALWTVLNVLFVTALLGGCSPVERNVDAGQALRPLSESEQAEFENVIEGLGRIEQIARVYAEKAPTWGAQDPKARAILEKLKFSSCEIQTALDAPARLISSTYSFAIQDGSSGLPCPFIASVRMTGSTQSGSVTLASDFISHDEDISALNGVQSFSVRGQGDRRQDAFPHFVRTKVKFEVKGSGKLATGDTFEINISRTSDDLVAKSTTTNGRIELRLKINAAEYVLEATLASNDAGDRSTYTLNGAPLTGDAFDSYFSRLGLIVGILPSNEAG